MGVGSSVFEKSRFATYSRKVLSGEMLLVFVFRGQLRSFGAGPAAKAFTNSFGSSCLSFRTSANKSPTRVIRLIDASGVNESAFRFFFLNAFVSSLHFTGIET